MLLISFLNFNISFPPCKLNTSTKNRYLFLVNVTGKTGHKKNGYPFRNIRFPYVTHM